MARKLERKELNQTVVIHDMINGGIFGELVNITTEGLMVMTDREIETQAIFQLALQLPEQLEGSDQLILGADCLWCRRAENFHRYWAGFQIIDASEQALAQIEALINLYGRN
jgi:PilZ domain